MSPAPITRPAARTHHLDSRCCHPNDLRRYHGQNSVTQDQIPTRIELRCAKFMLRWPAI